MNEIFNDSHKENSLEKLIEDKDEIDSAVLQVPGSTELLILNNDGIDQSIVGSSKDVATLSSLHPFINLENSFIITSSNGLITSSSLSGKLLPTENGKQNVVKLLEPPPKRQKQDPDDRLKEMLVSVQQTVLTRLDAIEKKVQKISSKCHKLEEKIDDALLKATRIELGYDVPRKGSRSKQIVLGIPVESGNDAKSYSHLNFLNCVDAYPDGSWLGNPDNPNCRVRCDISPKTLISINDSCTTPEKMALTLLDYLFDRETQACSNISGAGKHGKMQLDPLRIFGIRCHLTHMFNITEQQWHRIKLNIDSKCRTAFRRKQRGMPLTVKGFREKSNADLRENLSSGEDCSESSASALLAELNSSQPSATFISISEQQSQSSHDSILDRAESIKVEIPDVIHTDHGDIHVIRATLEQ